MQIHWRLARVYAENKAFRDVIRCYDHRHTFFYLDPPYYCIKVYRFNFEQGDFGRLAEVLGGLKGKFLMSLNDHKEVRRIFKGFRIQAVPTKYSSMNPRHKGRETARFELLIRNY